MQTLFCCDVDINIVRQGVTASSLTCIANVLERLPSLLCRMYVTHTGHELEQDFYGVNATQVVVKCVSTNINVALRNGLQCIGAVRGRRCVRLCSVPALLLTLLADDAQRIVPNLMLIAVPVHSTACVVAGHMQAPAEHHTAALS